MEFGPRALGAPLDPRRPAQPDDAAHDEPQDQVPRVVPAVRAGGAGGATPRDYFDLDGDERPYMLLVAAVARGASRRRARRAAERRRPPGLRSTPSAPSIPAVTHVDYSAPACRPSTRERNPRFHRPAPRLRARGPAARCWSTPRSTCAASRSSARPRTPTAASCAPRWTMLVLGGLILDRMSSPPGRRAAGSRTSCSTERRSGFGRPAPRRRARAGRR